jgi:hypothetical protein
MNKEFVTYEQSLALKELGFDESCFGCYELSELRDYKKGLEVSWIMTLNILNGYRIYDDETQMSAPLKQQVFRWFREKYGLYQQIEVCRLSEFKDDELLFDFKIIDNLDDNDFYYDNDLYSTYEEAENACIDKLIEIAKQQDDEK